MMNNDLISNGELVERSKRNLSVRNPGTFSERSYQDAINTGTYFPAVDAGPKWISVEDRLPEDMLADKDTKIIHCLVALRAPRSQPKRKPLVTKAQRQWNSWTKSWEWGRVSGVIHWMPLPEPPKEG